MSRCIFRVRVERINEVSNNKTDRNVIGYTTGVLNFKLVTYGHTYEGQSVVLPVLPLHMANYYQCIQHTQYSAYLRQCTNLSPYTQTQVITLKLSQI